MINKILEEAMQELRSPDSSILDVVGNKLVATRGNTYNFDQLQRVILFLKGLNWDQYTFMPGDDGSRLGYFFHLVKKYDDEQCPTDRKLEKQMLKLYLNRVGFEVSDTELQHLILLESAFNKVTQILTLFRRAQIPVQPPILLALDFLQISQENLLTVANQWIQGIDQWSEILLILSTVQSLMNKHQDEGARFLTPWSQGLDPGQRLTLLLMLREIDPTKMKDVLTRLPSLSSCESYAQKTSALMRAYEEEQKSLRQLIERHRTPIMLPPLPIDAHFEVICDVGEDIDSLLNL